MSLLPHSEKVELFMLSSWVLSSLIPDKWFVIFRLEIVLTCEYLNSSPLQFEVLKVLNSIECTKELVDVIRLSVIVHPSKVIESYNVFR